MQDPEHALLQSIETVCFETFAAPPPVPETEVGLAARRDPWQYQRSSSCVAAAAMNVRHEAASPDVRWCQRTMSLASQHDVAHLLFRYRQPSFLRLRMRPLEHIAICRASTLPVAGNCMRKPRDRFFSSVLAEFLAPSPDAPVASGLTIWNCLARPMPRYGLVTSIIRNLVLRE